MVKLRDVFTAEEQERYNELKKLFTDADTRSDINFYSKEIHKLLNDAEARYKVTKDIPFHDILTTDEQQEITKLKQCIVEAQTRRNINNYIEKIDEVLGNAENRYFMSK